MLLGYWKTNNTGQDETGTATRASSPLLPCWSIRLQGETHFYLGGGDHALILAEQVSTVTAVWLLW